MTPIILMLSQLVSFPHQQNIKLEVTGLDNSSSQWVFFAPHEDENVVNDYVKQHVEEHGGKFVILRQQGKRDITFRINDTTVKVDPNRIFTDAGRQASIQKLNPEVTPSSASFVMAASQAKLLSEFILATMGGVDSSKTWIAIHNNTNGYDNDGKHGIGTISINRYLKKLNSGSKFLIDVNTSSHDEDDLFFVTDKSDFDIMRKHQWNAILQNPQVATIVDEDDGSLSVFAEMNNIRYINIEAERQLNGFGENHLTKQQAMVDFTYSLLKPKKQ